MKKIIAATAVLFMALAGTAFAKDLGGMTGIDLSTGVSGSYFSNSSAQDATHFVISTGHAQGDKVYGTGDQSTAIMRKDLEGVTFDSATHLLTGYSSTAFDDGNVWSEM